MAKILKFPQPKHPFGVKGVKATFYDYELAENCCNDDSYRQICVKCEKCGRRFSKGILQGGSKE